MKLGKYASKQALARRVAQLSQRIDLIKRKNTQILTQLGQQNNYSKKKVSAYMIIKGMRGEVVKLKAKVNSVLKMKLHQFDISPTGQRRKYFVRLSRAEYAKLLNMIQNKRRSKR